MFEDCEGVRRYGSPEKGETIQPSPEELEHIDLYFGGLSVYPHIPTLTTRWLEELVREGMGADWRKQSRAYHYEPGASKDQLRAARLENGQNVWVIFYPDSIEVLEDYPRTRLAMLGALAPLEAGEADTSLIRRTLLSTGGSVDNALRELNDAKRREEQRMLEFAIALLRYHRSEFDGLPSREQRQLAVQVCERLNEVSKAERKLAESLEFGTGVPGKTLRSAVKDAALDVTLAELHDVGGIGYVKLGEMFSIEQSKDEDLKGDNQRVRKRVAKGRELLDAALDGGWEAEAARRRSR